MRTERRADGWCLLWSLVLAGALLGPALGPGYVLAYDMVWVPDLALRPDFLGLSSGLPRAVPSDAVVAALDEVLPGMVLQKVVLCASLVAGGVGAGRLVPGPLGARLVAVEREGSAGLWLTRATSTASPRRPAIMPRSCPPRRFSAAFTAGEAKRRMPPGVPKGFIPASASIGGLVDRFADARGMVFPDTVDAAGKDYTAKHWFGRHSRHPIDKEAGAAPALWPAPPPGRHPKGLIAARGPGPRSSRLSSGTSRP